LKAQGWLPELIAVKWRYVDIVVFKRLPRTIENIAFIVEAKRMDTGLEDALKQAQGYLKKLEIERELVVTDGIRYRVFAKDDPNTSIAYANLTRLKRSAPKLFDFLRPPEGAQ
jgi:hypothetical protein